ncbi:MFS transporter [Salinicoccus kekensis]|uniref:Sugar phosphate permease n=1 Tax=Salinicoccus kekensis TaxID=714307 RepID=A0A285UFP5_9STAP|nr:MFS transporter [Salinicoccus kekensis]SOC40700.1 sugar phosphate permease [Salinicoccus kekensis]
MDYINATSKYDPWKMLGCLFMIQVLMALVGRSLAPLGPLFEADLSLSKTQIGMLPAALFLGQALVSIPAGLLVDRAGTKKMLLLLTFCLGLSFASLSFSSFYPLILFLIMVGGFGYGAMHSASNRGVIYWFPVRRRGTAMGIKQTGITAGSAMAALILLPLATQWGWRPVLLIASCLLIVMGFIIFKIYEEPRPIESESPAGTAENILSSIKYLIKNRLYLMVSISAMALNGSQMILNTYIVLFTYEVHAIPLVAAGILLVISEVGGSIGRIVWGIVSDTLFRGNRIIVLVIIAIISSISALTLFSLPAGTSFEIFVPIVFVFGFCISGFNGIWMNAVTEYVPEKLAGSASGFSIMLGSWGVIIGPLIFGLIVDTGSYQTGWFVLFLVLLLITGLLIWILFLSDRQPANGE